MKEKITHELGKMNTESAMQLNGLIARLDIQ